MAKHQKSAAQHKKEARAAWIVGGVLVIVGLGLLVFYLLWKNGVIMKSKGPKPDWTTDKRVLQGIAKLNGKYDHSDENCKDGKFMDSKCKAQLSTYNQDTMLQKMSLCQFRYADTWSGDPDCIPYWDSEEKIWQRPKKQCSNNKQTAAQCETNCGNDPRAYTPSGTVSSTAVQQCSAACSNKGPTKWNPSSGSSPPGTSKAYWDCYTGCTKAAPVNKDKSMSGGAGNFSGPAAFCEMMCTLREGKAHDGPIAAVPTSYDFDYDTFASQWLMCRNALNTVSDQTSIDWPAASKAKDSKWYHTTLCHSREDGTMSNGNMCMALLTSNGQFAVNANDGSFEFNDEYWTEAKMLNGFGAAKAEDFIDYFTGQTKPSTAAAEFEAVDRE